MTAPWATIRHVQDGEAVAAGPTGRPTRGLEARTDDLKARLDGAELGSALLAYDQPIESAALLGQPVYLNTTTGRFELALVAVENDNAAQSVTYKESAYCRGVVAYKTAATVANILLYGQAALDISAATGGAVPAGTYYLSATQAGRLTRSRPAAAIPVLLADGLGGVFVAPQVQPFLDQHLHFSFALTCLPAGDLLPQVPGQPQTVSNGNSGLPGWLPADHAVFNGLAPMGARFGYNLQAQPSLNAVWPPAPLGAVDFVWDKGQGLVGGTVIHQGSASLVLADSHGIWWMADCYGEVPWPLDPAGGGQGVGGSLSSNVADGELCLIEEMRLTVNFARLSYAGGRGEVTELDLIDSDLLSTTTLLLNAATRSVVNDYLASNDLPPGSPGAVAGKLKVPTAGVPATATVRLRLQLRGSLAGTLPALRLAVTQVPRASSPAVLPGSVVMTLNTVVAIAVGQYVEVTTDSFPVAAGDTIYFSILRAAPDAYTGTVGLLDVIGVLSPGA